MSQVIGGKLPLDGIDQGKMAWVGNVYHGNHSPTKLVQVPGLSFGRIKFI